MDDHHDLDPRGLRLDSVPVPVEGGERARTEGSRRVRRRGLAIRAAGGAAAVVALVGIVAVARPPGEPFESVAPAAGPGTVPFTVGREPCLDGEAPGPQEVADFTGALQTALDFRSSDPARTTGCTISWSPFIPDDDGAETRYFSLIATMNRAPGDPDDRLRREMEARPLSGLPPGFTGGVGTMSNGGQAPEGSPMIPSIQLWVSSPPDPARPVVTYVILALYQTGRTGGPEGPLLYTADQLRDAAVAALTMDGRRAAAADTGVQRPTRTGASG